MAFNPFNIFRRNQRTIFAVVTVFTMFTFVLSSGIGGNSDFFEWLPNWIGSKKNKGEVLCVISGSKVTSRELSDIRTQRTIANQYMSQAAQASERNFQKSISSKLSRLRGDTLNQFSDTFGRIASPRNEQDLAIGVSTIERMIENGKSLKPEDLELAQEIKNFASLRVQLMQTQNDLYFSNIRNRTDRDAIEFLLWSKKADQYGIHFSEKDIHALIQQETFGQLGAADVEIRKEMAKGRGISDSRIWTALGAEFRVRLAQSSVLGTQIPRSTGTLSPPPVYPTAYDQFTFYRDKFSPTTYEMLSVPVANFIDQVKESPTKQDLEKLYTEYRSQEPNPASETPGFKEPRKAKFEWISATGSEPYYKTAAKDWIRESELQAKVGALMLPTSVVGVAATARVLTEPDLSLNQQYGRVRQRFTSDLEQQYSGAAYNFQMLDTSVVKPANLAAAVGGAAGSLLTGAPAFVTSAELLAHSARFQERRTRLRVGLPLVLGSVPGPGFFGTALAGVAASVAAQPAPLPVEVYRPDLQPKLLSDLAQLAMSDDLHKFSAELRKKTADVKDPAKKKAAVASYIEEFARTRGLTKGETPDFRDEYAIGDDPALAPLKEIMDKAPHGQLPVRFGHQLFWLSAREGLFQNRELLQTLFSLPPDQREQAFRQLSQMPDQPDTGVYQPRFYPNPPSGRASLETHPTYLIWRNAEKGPESLTIDQAKPKMEAAWKRIKARDLARQEAERIAAEMKAKTFTSEFQVSQYLRDVEDSLRKRSQDPKAQERVKQFKLDDVAEYQVPLNFQNPMAEQVRRFTLEPSAAIPYPTADMAKKLLDERNSPVGTSFVVTDQPKDIFYVAALAHRTELSVGDFKRRVYNAQEGSPIRQAVFQLERSDAYKQAREGALALLKTEFKYEQESTQKLDENEKRGD